jgi:hypothetical protein
MRYDIKLLKDGLRDVKKTRDILVGNLFPSTDWTEIEKVENQIKRIEKSIKILEND